MNQRTETKEESEARDKLLELCARIARDYSYDEGEPTEDDNGKDEETQV
jgi:hypothetical protein